MREIPRTWGSIELEVEFQKEYQPSSLMTIKVTRRHKIAKVLVLGDDGDWSHSTRKPGSQVAEQVNNGQKFLVVDLVIDFSRRELVRAIGGEVEVTVLIRLENA
jgi:hypothetical protein